MCVQEQEREREANPTGDQRHRRTLAIGGTIGDRNASRTTGAHFLHGRQHEVEMHIVKQNQNHWGAVFDQRQGSVLEAA